jgi:hypothetical protein
VKFIPARQLRTHLKDALNSPEPTIVGNYWHKRAILLPLSKFTAYDTAARRASLAKARRQFLAILKELRVNPYA